MEKIKDNKGREQEAILNLEDLNKMDTGKQNTNPGQNAVKERTPGITVIDEDGNKQRKKRPNSFGLSDEVLPPYTKKSIAIYQAIGVDAIDPLTGDKVLPTDIIIPGKYRFYDKFEKDPNNKNKIIKNITGTETTIVGGKEVLTERVEDIIMNNGVLAVPVESQYPLYVLMERHVLNGSNRFRPRDITPIFIRLDVMFKSPATINAEMDLAFDAEQEVRKLSKDNTIAYAASAGINTSSHRDVTEIKIELRKFARQHPLAYYKLFKNTRAAVKVNVLEALNLGLVEYIPDKKSYMFTTNEDRFFTHSVGEEPLDALCAFLAKDSSEQKYDYLNDQLNFWNQE